MHECDLTKKLQEMREEEEGKNLYGYKNMISAKQRRAPNSSANDVFLCDKSM